MSRPVARICLTPAQRRELLDHYRRPVEPDIRLRAPILLLLADGYPWATITAVLFCSGGTIRRRKARFERDGTDAVFGRPRGRRRSGVHLWATLVVRWVLTDPPTEFHFARSRWRCAAAVVLREDFGVAVGRETVRLWLRSAGLVWRRPRPVRRPKDPDREAKLQALRARLQALPADETAVFMDEVDINLNPQVGCPWMTRGGQASVETPGTNVKRYLAGSIHGRTGRVIRTEGRPKEGRGAARFVRHLDDRRRAFRHDRVIPVICDHARFPKPATSTAVREDWAAWSGRVVLHSLPTDSPDCNPVERVGWRLHEAVTRNHRGPTIEERLNLTFDWFATRTHFRMETGVYGKTP
jgi:putative transposase